MYIADTGSCRIRFVNVTSGIISAIAGNKHISGYDGDEIAATSAALSQPLGLAVDSSGTPTDLLIVLCLIQL